MPTDAEIIKHLMTVVLGYKVQHREPDYNECSDFLGTA